jgi:hypothetical protein
MSKEKKGWVDKHFYIHCGCDAMEHGVRIMFSKEEPDPAKDPNHNSDLFYISYFLETARWYKRIWIGLKYIFGFKSKYGQCGETLVHVAEAKRLARFLNDPEGTTVEDPLAKE